MKNNYSLFIIVVLLGFGLTTEAQIQKTTDQPIVLDWDICQYHPDPNPVKRTLKVPAQVKQKMLNSSTPCTEFQVTYTGFTTQAEAAFQYAVDIWSYLIESDVPIKINAQFTSLGTGVLGSAGAAGYYPLSGGSIPANTAFPAALADKIVGYDIDPGGSDINANFSNTFPFYFGLDGNTPGSQYDFVSVVLHELGHGLGFAGFGRVDDNDNPTQGLIRLSGVYVSMWDNFIENGSGTSVLTFADPSAALLTQFTSNDLYCNSPLATAENGGSNPPTYAPSTWNGGSSYSHWDESTFNGTVNALMTPQIGAGEAIHDPGPLALAFMEDMGWGICIPCADVDGDNFTDVACGGTDCDDSDPAVNPDAIEIYDGIDNNCDGQIDEGCMPNDFPANAIELVMGDTLCENMVAGSNLCATDSGVPDPGCGLYDGGDVWFYVTVPSTGEVTVETSESSEDDAMGDSVLSIYSTDGSGNIVAEIACNDDTTGLFSTINLTGLTEGDILLIRVHSFDDGLKGPFNICAWSPSTLSIKDPAFEGFNFYPNPTESLVHFNATKAIDHITIFNMLGQKVMENNPNNMTTTMDVSQLQSGTYFVNVNISGSTKIVKIVKN